MHSYNDSNGTLLFHSGYKGHTLELSEELGGHASVVVRGNDSKLEVWLTPTAVKELQRVLLRFTDSDSEH